MSRLDGKNAGKDPDNVQVAKRAGCRQKRRQNKSHPKHPFNGTTPLMCLKITAFLPLKTPSVWCENGGLLFNICTREYEQNRFSFQLATTTCSPSNGLTWRTGPTTLQRLPTPGKPTAAILGAIFDTWTGASLTRGRRPFWQGDRSHLELDRGILRR